MADTIERIYKITADASQAIAQLEKLNKSTGNIDTKLSKAGAALKGAFAGAAIGAAIQQTVSALLNTAEAMDEVSKSAAKFGIATEDLIGLKQAAEFSGVSFGALETGFKRLSSAMADVSSGRAGDAPDTLKQLGINVKNADGTLRSSADVFRDLADQFSKMPAGAEKTAAAVRVFGRAGADMIPLLNEGAEGLAEFTKQTEELGLAFNDTSGAMAEQFNDNLTKLGQASEGAKTQLMVGLLPALVEISNAFADSAGTGDTFRLIGEKIGKVMLLLQQDIKSVVAQFKYFAAPVEALLKNIGNLLGAVATGDFSLLMESLEADWTEGFAAMDKAAADAAASVSRYAEIAATDSATLAAEARKNFEVGLKADQPITVPVQLQIVNKEGKPAKAADYKDPFKEFNEALQDVIDASDPTAAAIREIEREMALLNRALAIGKIDLEDYDKAMAGLDKNMENAINGTKNLKDETQKLDEISVAVGQTLSSGVASFVDTLTSTGASFKQWAADMVVSIAKVIAQLYILKALRSSETFGGLFASAKGSAFSSLGFAPGVYTTPQFFPMAGTGRRYFANGGVGVFAEAGPEAIMPLRRDSSGRLGVDSAAPVVNVNVHNNTDANVSARRNGNNIDLIIDQVAADILRGGGRVSKALESTYKMGRARL